MSSAGDRFIAAITNRTRDFVCPQTGSAIEMTAPSEFDVNTAAAQVSKAWEDRPEINTLTVSHYLDEKDRHLMARVTRVDRELIGFRAIGALDEATFELYQSELKALRENAGDGLSDADIVVAIDELKKKPETLADTLSTFDSTTLRRFVTILVGPQSALQTLNSSTD